MRGRGVIQWIRLALDPAARRKAVEDARAAGRDIGGALGREGAKGGKDIERGIERGLTEGEREAKESARRIGNTFSRMGQGLRGTFSGIGGLIAGGLAALGVKQFIREMWELGTAAEETQSKFNTTFGREGAAQVQAFLDEWAALAGMNRTVGQEFAATAGAIVQGMGASQVASAALSEQVLRLAGDLQSFHNRSIQDAFTAIRGGITGETEALKSFGIVLRAAEVEQRALAETNKRSAKELTSLERAQAAVNLMVEQAGPALGDLERTQDSTANKARNLRAEYENMKIELAAGLMPVFANLIDTTSENKKEISEFAKTLADVARVIVGVVWAALNGMATLLAGQVAAGVGLVLALYRSLEIILLRVVLAKNKFARAFASSDEGRTEAEWAIRETRERIARAQTEDTFARNLMKSGMRAPLEAPGAALGAFRDVWNLGRAAPGEFEWTERRPIVPQTPAGDPARERREAQRAEREREAELTAQVRLLEEMAENRAAFPQLVSEATALEEKLTAELNSGEATTRRRVDLMRQVATLQDIRNGKDRTSLQIEEDRRKGLEDEVRILTQAFEHGAARADVAERASQAETAILTEMQAQGVSLQRQLELMGMLQRLQEARTEAERSTGPIASEDDPRFREDVDAILEYWAGAAELMENLATGFSDAWGEAFDLVLRDASNVAGAFGALAKGMAKALLGGVAGYAQGKVQENVASAIEELAKAAAAAGNPFLSWTVPHHLKAAAGHGLAATAWGVLAGASGAGARAIGGGGVTSAGGSGRVGGSAVDSAGALPVEVHLYVDGIQPRNSEHQRLTHETLRLASERLGSPINVTYHDAA